MKVKSSETIHFPSLNWGITAGETRELPEDKESQEVILSHPSITQVTGAEAKNKTIEKTETEQNNNNQ